VLLVVYLLVHFFARSKKSQRWGVSSREHVTKSVEIGKSWINRQGSVWDVDSVRFTDKILALDRISPSRYLVIPDESKSGEMKWVLLLLNAMGHRSWNSFVMACRDQYGIENVALLFHIDRHKRSFVNRYSKLSLNDGGRVMGPEYAVCYRKPARTPSQLAIHPYVHEIFHLFVLCLDNSGKGHRSYGKFCIFS